MARTEHRIARLVSGPDQCTRSTKINNSEANIRTACHAAVLALLAAAVLHLLCSILVGTEIRKVSVNRAPPVATQYVIMRLPLFQFLPIGFTVIVLLMHFRLKSTSISVALVGLGIIIQTLCSSVLLFALTVPFWVIRGNVPG